MPRRDQTWTSSQPFTPSRTASRSQVATVYMKAVALWCAIPGNSGHQPVPPRGPHADRLLPCGRYGMCLMGRECSGVASPTGDSYTIYSRRPLARSQPPLAIGGEVVLSARLGGRAFSSLPYPNPHRRVRASLPTSEARCDYGALTAAAYPLSR
ncbi:hypothetical protein C8Q76DRAFT_688054 [Earliella scabrosa]|nr:hypothetical protein C8Q76DRAFT_688054 [Earliella scabrosa]